MEEYLDIILITLFGFLFLAFILLAPVYVFLRRERKRSEDYTREIMGSRLRGPSASSNGAPHPARDRADEKTEES